MNGMYYDYEWAMTTGSDNYTVSWHYELPPTSTIGQLSLSSYYEFDDRAHVDLGFTQVSISGHKDKRVTTITLISTTLMHSVAYLSPI